MSAKRQATTTLNHDNWDQEDSNEHEEMGTFKTAPKEVLEKRVIRTAKRRSQVSNDEPKKSVFSGFGGFNKMQQSSFDFLANLTNGNKPNNDQPTTKTEAPVSSNIFTNKSLTTSPSTGFFNTSVSGSSAFATKPSLGKSPEGSSSLFGVSSTTNTSPVQPLFSASKADSSVTESTFKLQASPSTTKTDLTAKTNPSASTAQMTSIFGSPSNSSATKSMFSSSTEKSTTLPIQPVSSASTLQSDSASINKSESKTVSSDHSKNDENEERRLRYYSKLKGLNESVSDWIKKHVEETPLCFLTPIFNDYEKYLKEIQEEYKGGDKNVKNNESKTDTKSPAEETKSSPVSNTASSSIFGNVISNNSIKTTSAQNSQNSSTTSETKTPSFNFGLNTSTATTTSTGFSFGIKSPIQSTASSVFSVNTTSTTNSSTPFSFGINKSGFNFNTTTPPKTEIEAETKEEDDEPPKVEYTPIVEENSVFDKKCKIFIKKDGNFVDKGVGTLYIKKIEESGKHQLLVRANTNLGTVLLNLILSYAIPSQRMGKNNVMLVCIPTPEAKPPPTPILIRVKTAEEADELLRTLEKYKA